jgi:hypothetical protein
MPWIGSHQRLCTKCEVFLGWLAIIECSFRTTRTWTWLAGGGHTQAVLVATTDPICQSSSKSDSEYDGEVYMVEQGGQLPAKTAKEIQWEVEEEIARA